MILTGADATYVRQIFIESFIDTKSSHYQEYIQKETLFSDGWCYTGYLWDCLRSPLRVSTKHIMDFIKTRNGFVYILWDNHSKDKVLQPYYQKNAVLKVMSDTVDDLISRLPDDCYFFDDTLLWAAALTHEEIKPSKRLCFFVKAEQHRGQ